MIPKSVKNAVKTDKNKRKMSAVIVTTDKVLAEREGFEPSCGFPQTDFESAPL